MKVDEERHRSILAGWLAEGRSRPTEIEMKLWYRTIADLRTRLRREEDPEIRADVHHHLVTASVKIEDYAWALNEVEEALGEGIDGWKRTFLQDRLRCFSG